MYLFVYGTLKNGHRNNHYLEDQEFIGEFETEPMYRLFENGSFPMMIMDRSGYSVCGELWKIHDDEVIDELDLHEVLYERKEIFIQGFDDVVHAYIYVCSLSGCKECYGIWG